MTSQTRGLFFLVAVVFTVAAGGAWSRHAYDTTWRWLGIAVVLALLTRLRGGDHA
jgi:hypothetical protein